MKVSLNWVKEFTKVDLPIKELVEKISAQLGAVDEVVDLGKKYRGIVVAKVVRCEKHPDADKLSLCAIDDGDTTPAVKRNENGLVQVVCGAPNVRAGMLVAWLPPGTIVPSTFDKDPFVLEAREIRGQVSNGMLASPKELALGDNHEGILELQDVKPGDDFAKAYGLDDYIIDIENKMFTHRPDLFGMLGVAREVAGIQHTSFKSPDWYTPAPALPDIEAPELKLEIRNEIPELVSRFTAIAMTNIHLAPSPLWLQALLAKLGIKSINNIVDYSNYYMYLTAQPIHIYDYDKVKALSSSDYATMVIRHPRPGETITTLSGKTIEPAEQAMMVATDQKLICVGGAIGGSETEVDSNTKNIIIEAAHWDMFQMRRTSMEHGIFTDAVTRFTKGQSPLQNAAVVAKIVDEIRKNAEGKVASRLIDDKHLDETETMGGTAVHQAVSVSAEFINQRLGLKLSADEIMALLENVEFSAHMVNGEMSVQAPFWRTDIKQREDVVEEVGRLYGFDTLPLDLPKRDLTPAIKDPMLELKAVIRDKLSRAGANEVLAYTFVPTSLLEKVGQDKAKAYEIGNALSPDLQFYRMSLVPSLLEKVQPNIKAGYDEFTLFELGKTHSLDNQTDEEGLPREFEFTALVVAASDRLKKAGTPYYQARTYLEALVEVELSFKPVGEDIAHYAVVQPYDAARSALVSIKGSDFLGIIGEFKSSVIRNLKLPKFTAGFEIDTTVLGQALSVGSKYSPLSRFPAVRQDITLKVAADLSYNELYDFLHKELSANAPDNTRLRLDPIDIYQKAEDTAHKHVTFRVTVTGANRTLTDKEVAKVLDAVAETVKTKFDAERL